MPTTGLTIGTIVRVAGWHRWPGAHGTRGYLAHPHRHLFGLTAELDVDHDDRDIEFHDLREELLAWWGDEADQRDRGSCEQIAAALAGHLRDRYPGRSIRVRVDEDGEAWATLDTLAKGDRDA